MKALRDFLSIQLASASHSCYQRGMRNFVNIFYIIFLLSCPAYSNVDAVNFKYTAASELVVLDRDISYQRLPQRALDMLKAHKIWQTSAGLKIAGQAPALGNHRKWRLDMQGSAITLVEETSLTAEQNCSSKMYTQWTSGRVDLLSSLDIRQFIIGLPNLCSQKLTTDFAISYLSEDRFAIYSKGGGLAVLFFPSEIKSAQGAQISVHPVHIFTAPGISEELIRLTGLVHKENTYVHHDRRNSMPVLVDASFPRSYLPLLNQSLSKWNSALETDFFVLHENQIKDLDALDCLSSRKLCIFWNGPEAISFLGATAITSMTYDPQTGEIIGGFIGIASDAEKNMPDLPSSALLEKFLAENTTLTDIAQLFSMRESLKHFLHPAPFWNLKYVISHELGHFNGLTHNFYGDNSASSLREQKSVMDYLPFTAVNSKSGDIGAFDLEAIELIYKNKAPTSKYRFCSDLNSSAEMVSPDPNCNRFDLGSPENWLIELAKASSKGIFSPHPRFNGILLDYLAAFLMPGKQTVTIAQRLSVSAYLCENNELAEGISQYLKEKWQINFSCK